jgi:RNA polymerase sigma-32 factor
VLRNWRLVKVATTKSQRKLFFNLRKFKKNLGWLSAAETTAIARDLGVTEQDVTEMERRLSSRDVSYDPTPEAEDDESASYSPAAYLPAPDADPAVAIESAEWDDDVSDRVAHAMTQLDERSRAILKARWVNEPKATLHELADEYGVSAERIRQIEANAIKKLQKLVVPA